MNKNTFKSAEKMVTQTIHTICIKNYVLLLANIPPNLIEM